MRFAQDWTDRTRVTIQIALLGCCLAVTSAVRNLVDTDTLSDPADLALNAGALGLLLVSIVASCGIVRAIRIAWLRAGTTATTILLVGLAGAFVEHTYADVSIELADLIEPAQAAEGPTQIAIGPTGTDVRLSGDIKEGAAVLLDRILSAHPAVRRIHLTSDGGLAEEGQALAEVIAAHRLTTYVPDYCVSACTLAFGGGAERILMDGARLGFHAPYRQGVLGQTFAGDSREQRAAYIKAGLAADFVDRALKVAPDDTWFPERDELLAAHVATTYVDRYRFPDSILDGAADGQGARDAVLRNFAMLKSVDAAAPQAVDRIADWYLRAYRHGMSEGDATDGLKRIVDATTTLVLARADDATLLELARFIRSAMTLDLPSRDCAAIGERVDLVGATALLEDEDKDADARAESVVKRALTNGGGHTISETRAAPAAFPPADRSCASWRRTYGEIVARRDAAALRQRLAAARPAAARLLAELPASGSPGGVVTAAATR